MTNRAKQANLFSRLVGGLAIPQAEFARDIGETPQNITNWMKRGVPGDKAPMVARYFGITTDEFQSGEISATRDGRGDDPVERGAQVNSMVIEKLESAPLLGLKLSVTDKKSVGELIYRVIMKGGDIDDDTVLSIAESLMIKNKKK